MDLPGKDTNRIWDPFDKVRQHLMSLRDKASQDYYHHPKEREDRFYSSPTSLEDDL